MPALVLDFDNGPLRLNALLKGNKGIEGGKAIAHYEKDQQECDHRIAKTRHDDKSLTKAIQRNRVTIRIKRRYCMPFAFRRQGGGKRV